MEVAISTFRSQLSDWLARARTGEEVVLTDRGVPVARVVGLTTAPLIERLVRDGVISRPKAAKRPVARGRQRVKARGPVADLVTEQRR